MFRNCIFTKRLFLTPRLKPPNVQVRQIVLKKRKIFTVFDNSFEKYRKTKLVPEGYELVYVNKNNGLLNIGYIPLYMLYTSLGTALYRTFRGEQFLPSEFEEAQTLFIIGCFVFIIIIQGSLTRSVRLIIRKENEFKSIFYGMFGSLRKNIVAHGPHECRLPKSKKDLFHYLKNRRILLDVDSFIDMEHYMKMINSQ